MVADYKSISKEISMNAIGIDVSKGKSTVAVLQADGTIIKKTFDVVHS